MIVLLDGHNRYKIISGNHRLYMLKEFYPDVTHFPMQIVESDDESQIAIVGLAPNRTNPNVLHSGEQDVINTALQLIKNKNGEINTLKGNQNLMFQKMLKMFTENDQLIKMRNVLIQNLNKEKKINDARNLKIRTEKGKSSPMRRGGSY